MTLDAAAAIREYGVAGKCATIAPDEARVRNINLKPVYRGRATSRRYPGRSRNA